MRENNKPGRLKLTGNILLRILLPLHSVRTTVELARKEVQRTKESVGLLKEMGGEAHKVMTKSFKKSDSVRNDSFQEIMANRSDNALNQEELYAFFLGKKRIALGTALAFLLLGFCSMLSGIYDENWYRITLAIASLLASQPPFFMVALSAQLRLWQLRTGRLSKKEKGGLVDYIRELDGWWWEVLDPEFGRKPTGIIH